jgi:hypothetical protein
MPALVVNSSVQRRSVLAVAAAASLVLALALSAHGGNAAAPSLDPPARRAEQIGLAVGANRSLDMAAAYDKIARVADVAVISGGWDDWVRTNYFADDIAMARSRGMPVYLYLDVLNYSPTPREQIEIPDFVGVQGGFDNPAVRDAYLNLVTSIAWEVKPEYFVVLVESNMHKASNPTSYAAYKDFYPDVYAAVKSVSPSSKVAVSNVYSAKDEAGKREFGQDVADMDQYSDLLAVSTYPLFTLTDATRRPRARQIPDNFLAQLAGYSSHPLSIAETSWPSQRFGVPAGFLRRTIETSPVEQADYVAKLARSAQLAQNQGVTVDTINFIALMDAPKQACNLVVLAAPDFEWFCSLGIMDPDGTDKPAAARLAAWKAVPRKP